MIDRISLSTALVAPAVLSATAQDSGPASQIGPDPHWTKDVTLSPEGKLLFASVGSSPNILENGPQKPAPPDQP